MVRKVLGGMALVCVLATVAGAQQMGRGPREGRGGFGFRGEREQSRELTVEQQRKLGLSDEQIRKIAEARRDLEKERAKLEGQLDAARDAARAAYEEVRRLNQGILEIRTLKITKVYESVMTKEQLQAWEMQGYEEQARQWLRNYRRWLNLTDAQVQEMVVLLVPVYEKYDKLATQLAEARDRLAELRQADAIDVAAIDEAEKQVAELSRTSGFGERQRELGEAMRAGLMPEQLERLDRARGRGR